MRSLIIHLPRSNDRRANAEQLLSDLPNAELLDATDGSDPAQITAITSQPGNLHSPRYPFPLRPAEIAVFDSHRRAWQALLDSDDDYVLVAEDDLRIDAEGLARSLALVDRFATPEMYIRLPVKAREKPAHVLGSDGSTQFILPRVIGLQCICQIVGRAAAQRLLNATRSLDRPVDTFLQMHWITGQPVHAILPNGNREVAAQIGGSTIQTKSRTKFPLMREVRRAAYRAQITLRPQKP